jgi:hypothetical protein
MHDFMLAFLAPLIICSMIIVGFGLMVLVWAIHSNRGSTAMIVLLRVVLLVVVCLLIVPAFYFL